MWKPGIAEIIIVLIIVLLLFGPGRIVKVSKELGASITAFKEGLNGEKGKKDPEAAPDETAKEKKDETNPRENGK